MTDNNLNELAGSRLRRTLRSRRSRPATSVFMRRVLVPVDTFVVSRTAGRLGLGRLLGMDTLLLTTTGRRSRMVREVPLVFVPHRGGFAVAGSNFGRTEHPSWSANLLAEPKAAVTIRGRTVVVTARLLEGDERAEAWSRFVSTARAYRSYAERSGRDIRVFTLTPKHG